MSQNSSRFLKAIKELLGFSGAFDETNDKLLIYDASDKKLKLVPVSRFNAEDVGGDQTVTGSIDVAGSYKQDGITLSNQKWVDVTVTAALLDAAGTAPVIVGAAGDSYKIRGIRLVGGGTNFGAGGNRLISLTDGTTVWTTIANADIEAAPAATLHWGDAKVPYLTGTSDTASAAGQNIRFAYSGGTTDHSTGSIKFSVLLEKVA